ncbi:MAG: AI-2E family transporter [Methylococcaceae bacterium]|jgi:predicted PurR-regulated permease PerM
MEIKTTPLPRLLPLSLFLAFLGYLVFRVLGPLLEPIAWAIILTHATWPLYVRVRAFMGGSRNLSASVLVLCLGLAIVSPLLGLTIAADQEIRELFQHLPQWLEDKSALQSQLLALPLVGKELSAFAGQLGDLEDIIRIHLLPHLKAVSRSFLGVLENVGLLVGQWALSLFFMFFLYRDGDTLIAEVRDGIRLGIGERADRYVDVAEQTGRAVIYGLIFTAIGQGVVAGIGYWGAGMPTPTLLMFTTILLAMIPFGAVPVWVGSSLWLLFHGDTTHSLGLFLWGVLVVSWVDNLIRPFVISRAGQISFGLVVLGVVGGLLSFGFIGLFVGPVVLAIAHAVWHEWLKSKGDLTG